MIMILPQMYLFDGQGLPGACARYMALTVIRSTTHRKYTERAEKE